MTLLSYSRYSRDPQHVAAANWQLNIFQTIVEYEEEQSDRAADAAADEDGDMLMEYLESLQALRESPDYFAWVISLRLKALAEADDYLAPSQAASILEISEAELREDIEAGRIPMTGDSVSAKKLMYLVATEICW